MRSELSIVSFICTILVLIPLPWHWRARNIPTLSLTFWLTVVNLPRGINAIIWAGSTNNYAPVWCDFTTKLVMGANWGYCTSTIPMCRHLARISSPHNQIENAGERRRRMIFEIFMCAVLPLIAVSLHYLVQDYRFAIYEDFGCVPSWYEGITSIMIVNVPPVVFALIALVYAAVALHGFVRRRTKFDAALHSYNYSLTTSRHLRLIALLTTTMLAATSMTTLILVENIADLYFEPWGFVHVERHLIYRFARGHAPESWWDNYLLTWYLVPITSVIFFAFFGFEKEVRVEYTKYFNFLKTKMFRIKKSQPILPALARDDMNTTNSTISIPTVVDSYTETVSPQILEK